MTVPATDTTQVLTALPEVLHTIEGTVAVPTEDDALATVALDGLRYLSAVGFARAQPALALLYELQIVHIETRPGSRLIDFKIYVRLRERVRGEIDRAGAVALIGVVLALPGAISASTTLWSQIFPRVEQQMQNDLPQCPPTITFIVHPAPEKPHPFHGGGRSFNL